MSTNTAQSVSLGAWIARAGKRAAKLKRKRERTATGWRPAALQVACARCGATSTSPITSQWTLAPDGTWTCPACRQDGQGCIGDAGGDSQVGRDGSRP